MRRLTESQVKELLSTMPQPLKAPVKLTKRQTWRIVKPLIEAQVPRAAIAQAMTKAGYTTLRGKKILQPAICRLALAKDERRYRLNKKITKQSRVTASITQPTQLGLWGTREAAVQSGGTLMDAVAELLTSKLTRSSKRILLKHLATNI